MNEQPPACRGAAPFPRAAAGTDHNLAAANRVRQRCDRLERERRADEAARGQSGRNGKEMPP